MILRPTGLTTFGLLLEFFLSGESVKLETSGKYDVVVIDE